MKFETGAVSVTWTWLLFSPQISFYRPVRPKDEPTRLRRFSSCKARQLSDPIDTTDEGVGMYFLVIRNAQECARARRGVTDDQPSIAYLSGILG